MKKASWILAGMFVLVATAAQARPLSSMEWMDTKSFDIWKSLTAAEKADSIKAMENDQSGGISTRPDADSKFLLEKTQTCLEKEVADPDYNGAHVPLYVPWVFCTTKYNNILDSKNTIKQ